MISAIVHTQGVVLKSSYVPLELAYIDVLGVQAHFHINSPIPYSAMRKFYPNARPDVIVITDGGTPYSQVLEFLKNRFQFLSTLHPDTVFGYKGASFQPQVLRDAGIASIVNLEEFGVPPLSRSFSCPWHRRGKCAVAALDHILRHVPGSTRAASPARQCAAAP